MVNLGVWKKQENVKAALPAGLVISHDRFISALAVQEICASVGWTRRELTLIARALENSLAVTSVWEKDKLVAFARATGDKVFNATVWDVVVRPSHQHMGLGLLVMNELLNELDSYQIPLVTLYADPGTDGFYKRFGFLTDPSGVRGMFREKL
jgi:aralkylamine N-acetyltransferase